MLTTRARRSLLAGLIGTLACSSPSGTDSDTIDLTVRITLAGNRNIGTTAARIYVFEDVAGVQRAGADTRRAQSCALDVTPVTTCTIPISSGSTVTLIAVESNPAVFVRLEPVAASDTIPNGDFVEFLGWSSCADLLDRGTCVLAPNGRSIEATYQLMNQVTVYQTGAAAMDYVTIADPAVLPLRIPPENFNILNQAGCRGRLNFGPPCDAVRLIGDEPWHRFTAFVPRGTIVGMFPSDGAATTFLGWTGDCILSGVYGGGVCSLIAPETSGNPIVLTLRYEWWDCPGGPRDNDAGGCVLRQGQGSRVQGTGKD